MDDRFKQFRRYLPPNVIDEKILSNFLPKWKYVGVTFILLSAVDVSEDELLHMTKRTSSIGHRIRTVICPNSTETCAQITKRMVTEHISFLENVWSKNPEERNSNMNLVFHYGDGSSSNVYLRKDECLSNNNIVSKIEFSFCLKMLVDGSSCKLTPNDIFYDHASLSSNDENVIFIYPSRNNLRTYNCTLGKSNQQETTILVSCRDNSATAITTNFHDGAFQTYNLDSNRTEKSNGSYNGLEFDLNDEFSAEIDNKNETQSSLNRAVGGYNESIYIHDSTTFESHSMEYEDSLNSIHSNISSDTREHTLTEAAKNINKCSSDEEKSKMPLQLATKSPRLIHIPKMDNISSGCLSHNQYKNDGKDSDEEEIKSPMRQAVKTPRSMTKPNREASYGLLSPYILFCNDRRAEIRRQNPKMGATDAMKKLSQLWRKAGSEIRNEYSKQSIKLSFIENDRISKYRKQIASEVIHLKRNVTESESSSTDDILPIFDGDTRRKNNISLDDKSASQSDHDNSNMRSKSSADAKKPGPKVGSRPIDFDEDAIRCTPTFIRWDLLAEGESLHYSGRVFLKGKATDEERLMRRIMINKRNNKSASKSRSVAEALQAKKKQPAEKKEHHLSGYQLFNRDFCKSIEKGPCKIDYFKMASEAWSQLGIEVKNKYQRKAEDLKKKCTAKESKKRSLTAYNLFARDFISNNQNISMDGIFKVIGKAWRALDADQKKIYVIMAQELKAEVRSQKVGEFKDVEIGAEKVLNDHQAKRSFAPTVESEERINSKKAKLCDPSSESIFNEFESKNKTGRYNKRAERLKRPPSAYVLFNIHSRDKIFKENPGMPIKDVMTKLAKDWKSLSEEARKPFEEESDRLHTEYLNSATKY